MMGRGRLVDIRDLIELNPAPGAHRPALRAAISVAVPLLILWGIGRLDWSMYASFGAFTSLYGRNHLGVPRARMQSFVGAFFTGCIVLGVLVGISPHRSWIAVPVAAALAGVATSLSDRFDWHPPGALFTIFSFAGCASIPTDSGDLLPALLIALASASFSVFVGSLGDFARSHGKLTDAPDSPSGALARHSWRAVGRAAAAVLIAGSIATGAGIGHPYWAMVAAVVPLASSDVSHQIVRGIHRLVGTAFGLVVSAIVLSMDLPEFGVIVAIVAFQVGAELLVGVNYALALISITPLALLMGQLAVHRPVGTIVADRAIETCIGVLIGVAVGWFTRRRAPR